MSRVDLGRAKPVNTARQVLFASLIGTTIEFFDFYIYATAAVIVFPRLFFPASDPASATLASLATFAIAFFARPIGSALFGHFGDRIGRKTTLVAALLTMGISTVVDRPAADLRSDRRRRAAAARAVPFRPGPGARRRVGRRGAARDRERAAGQARLVRHVPAARRADRVLLFRLRLPAALRSGSPTSSSSPSAGASRFSRAPCSCSSASTSARRSRDAGLPRSADPQRARQGADGVVFRHYPRTLVSGRSWPRWRRSCSST